MSDAFLVEAIRSAVCPQQSSLMSGVAPLELLRQTIEALLRRTGLDPNEVDRVLIQCGDEVRDQLEAAGGLAWPLTGLPAQVPAITIDRWCGTGQEILHHAARSVAGGNRDIVIVAGVESTYRYDLDGKGTGPHRSASPPLSTWPHPRGLAAELLTAKMEISRDRLDAYAARSNQRAFQVATAGEFDKEITPIHVGGHGMHHDRIIVRDELLTHELTAEELSKLPPFWDAPAITDRHPGISGTITAGNSARRAIGTSAVMLMSEQRATRLGIKPRARIHQLAVARGDSTMPLGAVIRATEKILEGAQMTLAQLDHVEVDEEFACVPLAWQAEFEIDPDLFNPRGGALALGDPRACGAIRQLTTMLSALNATGGRFGLQAMNANRGAAYASLIERC